LLLAAGPYCHPALPDLDLIGLLLRLGEELPDCDEGYLGDKGQVTINAESEIAKQTASSGFHGFQFLLFAEIIANLNKVVDVCLNQTVLRLSDGDEFKEFHGEILGEFEKYVIVILVVARSFEKRETGGDDGLSFVDDLGLGRGEYSRK
jgi:hypothetical protein